MPSIWSSLARAAATFALDRLLRRRSQPSDPTPDPTPEPAPTRHVRITLWRDGAQFRPSGGSLHFDDPTWTPLPGDVEDSARLHFALPMDAAYGWHARLVVFLGSTQVTEAFDVTLAPDIDLLMRPSVPPLPAIGSAGRYLVAGGRPLRWFGITAFQLVEMVAHGREGEVDAYLRLAGANRVMPRVLCMCANLFRLEPAEGLAALPRFLELARRHGVYVELTVLADTRSYPDLDLYEFVRAVGNVAADAGNAIVEIGNELLPLHPTQSDKLADAGYLQALMETIHADVPVSLGSTHANEDESPAMAEGDYLTAHMSRSNDDNGWKWVRHTNELGWLADDNNLYAINDEPRRDDLTPGKHLAVAFLCRAIRDIGHTFHYAGGLAGRVPVGDELRAWTAAARGFYGIVPPDWRGTYKNAGQTGSPVKAFENALRVYSSVAGNVAYSLALDAANARIEWADGWKATEIVEMDGARIFLVEKTN